MVPLAAASAALQVIAFAALTLLGCALLLAGCRHLTGTTLIGPCGWAIVATCVIGVTEILLHAFAHQTAWTEPVRFAASTTCFCPLMSLLGAKRPQDKAWHFVVLSLWAILVLPAAESLVLRHGQMPDVRGARSWFMLALIAVGLLNALPTRFWLAGILACTGQILMLSNYLPFLRDRFDLGPILIGFALWVSAVLVLVLRSRRDIRDRDPFDAIWLDFRDSFGALWALRVAERINAASAVGDWPIGLAWKGFFRKAEEGEDSLDELPHDVQQAVRQSFDNLLRRFVSEDWITARLDKSLD
ncbi:MAG: hypothetical protein CMJ64_12680 [Planctomycetaceae bacterium]|nr:hypothetical protein [Planctomycetaceae bacterium]